ncbi:Enhancer of polycomb-like [Musa troglodytarum]|uniref:Enhancer of polycomb-like protein n=1 Tax=Musa troglodytarum TaxID=320322 RepID=A0A9E7I269_9LILI|nr:Enhancer of polycomb-like [Musa troglodytarum]
MEISLKRAEASDIPKKPRSLDLQSIYVKKSSSSDIKSWAGREVSRLERESEVPKRKLGSSFDEVGELLSESTRKPSRKEVSLSNLQPDSKRQRSSLNVSRPKRNYISTSGSDATHDLDGSNGNAQYLGSDLYSPLSNKTDHASPSGATSKNKSYFGEDLFIPKRPRGISKWRKAKDPISFEVAFSKSSYERINTDAQNNKSSISENSNSQVLNDKQMLEADDFELNGYQKDDSAPCTSVENDSHFKSDYRKYRSRINLKMSEQGCLESDAPLIDDSGDSVEVSQDDDDENLEVDAARMLSSRFDPSCTGFSGKRTTCIAEPVEGLTYLQSDHAVLKVSQSEACSVDATGRVLRPRRHIGKSFARKRRHFYEVCSRDMDPYYIVKQRIRVFWPLDKNWYFGLVKGYDPVTRLHHVKYDDRDEEWINLQKERFKLLLFPSEVSSKFNFGKRGSESRQNNAEGEPEAMENSYIGSLLESEPIISWLSRTTRRVTSSPSSTIKKHLRVSPLKDISPMLLESKESMSMNPLDKNPDKLFFNCNESEQSCGQNFNRFSELKSSVDSECRKLPYVYFRKRFRSKRDVLDTRVVQGAAPGVPGGSVSIYASVANSTAAAEELNMIVTWKEFKEGFWGRSSLVHRFNLKKLADPNVNSVIHYLAQDQMKPLLCSLYFAAAPSFSLGLHLKLLNEKDTASLCSGDFDVVSSQNYADNYDKLTADGHTSLEDPFKHAPEKLDNLRSSLSEAEATHGRPSLDALSAGSNSDLNRVTKNFFTSEDNVIQNAVDSSAVGKSISGEGVVQYERFQCEDGTSQFAEDTCSECPEHSSFTDKSLAGGCSSFVKTANVEGQLFDEVEKHSLHKGLLSADSTSNLVLDLNEHTIHSPTAPRSMWHRNRHTSLSRTFIHHPRLGSKDVTENAFTSGYKRPRTQVSYSQVSGGYGHAAKSRSSHQKVQSHKKVKTAIANVSSNCSRSHQSYLDSLACDANVLVTHGDKCWREFGAKVQLDCDDQKNWRICIKVSGAIKYVYKAHHVLQPGTTNRYTHAMMWKGGKEWMLEFTDRNQWYIFKQMHEGCYNQNIRAASVKNIPIPGVRLLPNGDDGCVEVPFVRSSSKYFRQVGTEADLALDSSHVLYDMDSEDEEWISTVRGNMDAKDGKMTEVTDDMFERVMDMLEKFAYTQQCEEITNDDIEKYVADDGPADTIKVIYEHWRQKRKKKGLPLIRQFQAPLWELYQQQLNQWESNMNKTPLQPVGCHEKAHSWKKPPMFAFCLRPRGMEIPNKGSKQRSHKKLIFTGHHNVLMREQDCFHTPGRKMDGISVGEGAISSYESSDSYHGPQSRSTFSPRDTASTESFFTNDGENFTDPKFYRSTSKKFDSFLSPRDPQGSPFSGNQRSNRNGLNRWSSELCEWSSIRQSQSTGFHRHHTDMDEFRLRDATSAAQHALNMAKLKREKAQWLLHKADLALHRATVALMTAEAIKASEKDIVESSAFTGSPTVLGGHSVMELKRQQHFLVATFPFQGHINPVLHLAKHLARSAGGPLVTFSTSLSAHRRMFPSAPDHHDVSDGLLSYLPFSDGFDDGDRGGVAGFNSFMAEFKVAGPRSLSSIVAGLAARGRPVTCIVYTMLLPWAADVAREHGIPSIHYWIQPATVFAVYYHCFHDYGAVVDAHRDDPSFTVTFPRLPPIKISDVPSFLTSPVDHPLYSVYLALREAFAALDTEKAASSSKPRVLVNTFDELEPDALAAVDEIDMLTIGPLIPSWSFQSMGPGRHVTGMSDTVADRTAEAEPVASVPGSSREWEGGGTRAENKGADEMGRRLEKGTLFQSSPSVSPSIFRGYKRKREERTLFRCRSSRLQDSRTCPTGLAQSLHSELFMSSWVPLRIPSWKPKSDGSHTSQPGVVMDYVKRNEHLLNNGISAADEELLGEATQTSKEMKRRSSVHFVLLRFLLSMPIWYTMIMRKQMGFGEHGRESLDPSRSDIAIPRRVPALERGTTARPTWDGLPPMMMLIHRLLWSESIQLMVTALNSSSTRWTPRPSWVCSAFRG